MTDSKRQRRAPVSSQAVTGHSQRVSRLTELHPEELFDKETSGTLTEAERAQLEAHLSRCAACRLEREARSLFHAEALGDSATDPLSCALKRLTEAEPGEAASWAPRGAAVNVMGQAPADRGAHRDEALGAHRDEALGAHRDEALGAHRDEALGAHRDEALSTDTGEALGNPGGNAEGDRPLHVAAPRRRTLSARSLRQWPLRGRPSHPLRHGRWALTLLVVSGTAAAWVGWAPAPILPTAPAATLTPAAGHLIPQGNVLPPGAEAVAAPEAPAEAAAPAAAPSPPPEAEPQSTRLPSAKAASTKPASTKPASASRPRAEQAVKAAPALMSAAERFAAGNRARGRGELAAASQHYSRLVAEHPNTREAHAARALLGQLALDEGRPEQALTHYEQYLGTGEVRPVLSEEALIGRARALSQLGHAAQAASTWRHLLQHYPDSAARAEAERHLTP